MITIFKLKQNNENYMQTDPNNLELYSGITEKEAQVKHIKDGYNELPSSKPRSNLAIIIDVVKEPMFILLLFCSVLYLILGDLGEALMLFAFVFVVMGITLYQERKTERALEALKDLSSPRALVIRDKESKRIASAGKTVQELSRIYIQNFYQNSSYQTSTCIQNRADSEGEPLIFANSDLHSGPRADLASLLPHLGQKIILMGPKSNTTNYPEIYENKGVKITHLDIHQAGPFFGTLVLQFQRYRFGA